MYADSIQTTDWMTVDSEYSHDTFDEWKETEIEIDPIAEQSQSGRYKTLSAQEAAQLEEIQAGRIKVVKPVIAEYRKPRFNFSASFPAAITAIKYSMVGTLLMGLVVAFFVGTSGVKLSQNPAQSPAPARVARTAEPAQKRASGQRRVSRTATVAPGAVSSATTTASHVAASAAPVSAVETAPVVEYKGPSSVTGAAVSHRRAYQTSALDTTTR